VHTNFWGSSLELKAGRFIATEQVQVFQFNEVCREFRPTFIVCDIEGGEAHLFDNANLTGVTRVLLEIHSSIMGNDGVRNLFDRMSEKGFCYDENHSCGRIILFSRSSL
jgi:hypothetical protein